MKRRNRNHIIRPKMPDPPTRMPFTFMAGRFIMSTTRRMIAMRTGPPTISAEEDGAPRPQHLAERHVEHAQ